MSRINIDAVLKRLEKNNAAQLEALKHLAEEMPADAGLLPASPKAKPKHCGVCGRVFRAASAVCPDWYTHKKLYVLVDDVPILGDATDHRNYIGGWGGAGRAILKGTKVDNRDRRVVGGVRSAQRMKAAKAKASEAEAEAKALAEREAAYQAIVWPSHVTELQRRAYYLHVVRDLSFAKTGKKMGGITKATAKWHHDRAKPYA